MKSFVKFRPKQTRRRQARWISSCQSALERLEDRCLLAAPTVPNPIDDQTANFGTPFEFTIPSNTFADADGASTLTFTASGRPAWLMFDAATKTFTGTPLAGDAGTSNITVTVSDGTDTANDTFALSVANVVPSFSKGANQTDLEDAVAQTVANWTTNISQGLNESGQTVEFLVSTDNPGLFSDAPDISPTGTLTYTPAANANGSTIVTVFLRDNGGTANGGVEASASQTFTISVTAVNDAPSFTKGADQGGPGQLVLEDSGAQSVANWATMISAGPNDSDQAVDFQVSNTNNSLFSVQPAISATGTLTYTPAVNQNGTATVTVFIHDNGGMTNGGFDTSLVAQTFTITITPVNDVPSFTKGANQTALEQDISAEQTVTGWATNISKGHSNEATQTVNFLVSNDSTGLFTATGQPAIASNGTLTYTPSPNANGTATVTVQIQDDGTTENGGVDTSVAQTFTITLTAVNDAPTFTIPLSNQSTSEDSGAQSVVSFVTDISAGPNESTQTVDFQVTNDHTELFSVQPTISATGTLAYTPAANANTSATGPITIKVKLHDNGGTTNGGLDTSAEQTFTITIDPVNDAPSFTKGANQTVLEDSGVKSIPGWATNINKGPANESGQAANFLVSSDNPGLFTTLGQPAVSPNGTLTFTPAENANGTTTVTIFIHDDGTTANSGVDTSASQTFTITITAVNDAPSFTKGPDLSVAFNSAAQTVTGWATNILAGPSDEASQTLTFLVSTDNPLLFSVPPAISSAGVLTYTPAVNMRGIATVSVRLKDNGGTTNGGTDTSDTKIFTISIGTDALPTAPGGNAVYTASANAKLRAFVVNGLLSVQINGIQYPTYVPASVTSLTINGGSKNDEVDLSGLDPTSYAALTTVKIKGNAGNDRLAGSFANDSVDAGAGNDTLTGGEGDDTLIGNAGTDLLVETATIDDIDLFLTDTSLTGLRLGMDRLVTIENASLTANDLGTTIDASDFTRGAVTLIGGEGNDTLTGGSKNDAITGRDGADELTGGAGNDTILGGFGEDVLKGGLGSDLLIGGFDVDDIDGEGGRDTVVGGNGGAARGGDGTNDGDTIEPDPAAANIINEAFKKLFAFE